MKPLVTVLVVTYNHINTFEKAIESVLEQETNFSYKIWVLDDASTDGTTDLVKKYAKKYPDKVIPFIREHNLGGIQNVFQALKQIDTKYFATLESDDYWCDTNKLQKQVNILEKHPECSICTHNSYRCYPNNTSAIKHNTPYIPVKIKSNIYSFPKKISKKQYIEPHYSSRMYRTSCLNLDILSNPIMVCYDIASIFWFLRFGKLYYLEDVMSVYNFSYSGVYSGADSKTQNYMSANVIHQINKELKYSYNSMFLDFFKKKIPISFLKTLKIKYFMTKEELEKVYPLILENYIKPSNDRINSKILFNYAIPIGNNKKLRIEIKREKEM